MATGTNGIATRENVNDNIASNAYGSSLKRCVTAASINSNTKVQIKSSYASRYTNTNRLVRFSDIEAAPIIIRVSVDVSDSSYLYGSSYNPLTLMTGGRQITDLEIIKAAAPTSLSSTSQNDESSSLLEDSYVIDSSIYIPSDYSLDSLDTLDNVMKVVDDFEKKEQESAIARAALLVLGMTLTKDGTAITLDASYTASANSSKIAYFTLKTINAPTSSNYGNYVLSYGGNSLIKNKDGLYPTGSLYATDSSAGAREETISIQSPGTYTFTTYFKLGSSSGGGGITPSYKTWYFKLRLRVRDLAFYQIYTGLRNWVLYDSDGTVLTSGDKTYAYYTQSQFEQDLMNSWDEVVGESVYIVSLGSYTESATKGAPAYIDYNGFQCSMTANNLGALQYVSYRIENTMHTTYDRVSINTDNLNRCYFSVVVQGTNM